MHTTHTSRSQSRGGSYISQEENTRSMQLEIDHFRKRHTTSDREGLPQILTLLLKMIEMAVIGLGHLYECKNKGPSHKGLGNNALSKALNQISKSPFTRRIESGKLPCQFTQPTFTMYNGKIDPVEHVSHFNQRMVVHYKNEALMCKMFPSSLGPVMMGWFDSLREGFINSFKQLTRVFGAWFVTCSKVPCPLDSLLSMTKHILIGTRRCSMRFMGISTMWP